MSLQSGGGREKEFLPISTAMQQEKLSTDLPMNIFGG
jgi:hypothetical protein